MIRVLRPLRIRRKDESCGKIVKLIVAKRRLITLAIESSCDDTSVAVLEKHDQNQTLKILFHEKVTANNLAYRGVHPLVSLDSHEQNLAPLISAAVAKLPHSRTGDSSHGQSDNISNPEVDSSSRDVSVQPVTLPDFITVTRGPGMRSSLNTGLNTAKGLAAAWQIPLVAVNHMQAHALTPRLVSAMSTPTAMGSRSASPPAEPATQRALEPRFPFLSLLVSGGHTMLLRSESLCRHITFAQTADIAVGDAIDKIARDVLPSDVLATSASTMYGPLLERFAFPAAAAGAGGAGYEYEYEAPATRRDEIAPRVSKWGWRFVPIFAASRGGAKAWSMEFSFSGLCSSVKRVLDQAEREERDLCVEERRELGREAMRIAFEHLASRVVLALKGMGPRRDEGGEAEMEEGSVEALVVSGGVAANGYLRHILRAFLDVRGYQSIQLVFPPLELCTDNAVMIGWTGIEMFEAGWTSDLGCRSLRKWSLDPGAEDGGILGVSGWKHLSTC